MKIAEKDEVSEETAMDGIGKADKSAINKLFTESKVAKRLDKLNKNILSKSAGTLRAWDQVGIPGSGDLSDGLKKVAENTLGKSLSVKNVSADVLEKLADGEDLGTSVKEVWNSYKEAEADVVIKTGVIAGEMQEKAFDLSASMGEAIKDSGFA